MCSDYFDKKVPKKVYIKAILFNMGIYISENMQFKLILQNQLLSGVLKNSRPENF